MMNDMQRKVDAAASEAARAEGNNAFKRGKWVESIGHYTTATVHNPDDPLAFCNRAQAYLKLDKWQDAERDCTTALELQKRNIKALYRRALARKGMKRYDEALEDMEAVIKLEAGNATAREEREDIIRLREIEKTRKRSPAIPTAAQRQSAASVAEAAGEPQSPSAAALVESISKTAISPAPTAVPDGQQQLSTTSPQSFADLRKSRTTKMKTFASGSSALPSPIPTPAATKSKPASQTEAVGRPEEETSRSSIRQEQTSPELDGIATANSQPVKPGSAPRSSSAAANSPSPATTIAERMSASGTGVQLIRKLNGSPAENWIELSGYEPRSLIPALQNLLEPDIMGKLLLALRVGASQGQQGDIRVVMQDLRRTPRFSMNVAMLSKGEREAALEAWTLCGSEGAWI